MPSVSRLVTRSIVLPIAATAFAAEAADPSYRVVRLRAATPAEVAVLKTSEIKQVFAEPETVIKVARVEPRGSKRRDLVVIVEGRDWCGSGGCTNYLVRIKPDGGTSAWSLVCHRFGGTDKIGVGYPDRKGSVTLYSLDRNDKVTKPLGAYERSDTICRQLKLVPPLAAGK